MHLKRTNFTIPVFPQIQMFGGVTWIGSTVEGTFLTVRLSIFHMEEAVSERLSTGGTHKAGCVPCLSQCMHHLLHKKNTRTNGRSVSV